MEFIAAVVAIVALVFVLKMRKRVTDARAARRAIRRASAAPRTHGRARSAATVAAQPCRRAAAGRRPHPPRQPSRHRLLEPDRRARDRPRHQGRRRRRASAASARRRTRANRRKSFEERFGASWVVWIGGLALALGGIFLVQYSIEAGLIGPGVRIFLGGLLAAALIAAGEWTRRQEIARHPDLAANAHIPSILTAAGTTVAYATIYAAYALYGFLVPGTRVRAARHRGARDARRRAAARAGARRARPGRRVRRAAAGRDRHAELLGALHLSRGRHRRPRSRSRACGCGAGSRSRRSRSARSGCSPASTTRASTR